MLRTFGVLFGKSVQIIRRSDAGLGLPVQSRPHSGTGELHLIVDSTGLKLRGVGEWSETGCRTLLEASAG